LVATVHNIVGDFPLDNGAGRRETSSGWRSSARIRHKSTRSTPSDRGAVPRGTRSWDAFWGQRYAQVRDPDVVPAAPV